MLKYTFVRKKIKIYVGVEYRLEFIYNIKNIKKHIDMNIFKKVVMY